VQPLQARCLPNSKIFALGLTYDEAAEFIGVGGPGAGNH
jgi:hypothetical protein